MTRTFYVDWEQFVTNKFTRILLIFYGVRKDTLGEIRKYKINID